MKKTVSVNIKGINFLIEEDAYETLENYLARLKKSLNNQEGADEIIEDIEIRIAELCSQKLGEKKQVVELEDIQSILVTLGDPEQYVQEEEDYAESNSNSNKEQEFTEKETKEKRLYRDTDNAQIAGVCQGIANYFNIDVVIIRIVWALIFLVGGFGLLAYIILWVVIPKANSSIDRLRMKGKPITVDNVRDEVEQAAEKFKKSSKKFADNLRNDASYSSHINLVGRIITICFAVAFILIGIGLLITFLIFILGGFEFIPAKTDTGFLSLTELGELILPNSADVSTAWIGGLLLSISAISFLFLLGFFLLFKLKNKWTKITLLGLFFTGLIGGIICLYLGMKTARDYSIQGEIERTIGSTYTQQLVIEPLLENSIINANLKIKASSNNWLPEIRNNRIYESNVRFRYHVSNDSLFHIYETAESQAYTSISANEKATNINHSLALVGDTLMVGTQFSYPMKDKFRAQRIKVIVEIPVGKTVLFNGQIIDLQNHKVEDDDDDMDNPSREKGRLLGNGIYEHGN